MAESRTRWSVRVRTAGFGGGGDDEGHDAQDGGIVDGGTALGVLGGEFFEGVPQFVGFVGGGDEVVLGIEEAVGLEGREAVEQLVVLDVPALMGCDVGPEDAAAQGRGFPLQLFFENAVFWLTAFACGKLL